MAKWTRKRLRTRRGGPGGAELTEASTPLSPQRKGLDKQLYAPTPAVRLNDPLGDTVIEKCGRRRREMRQETMEDSSGDCWCGSSESAYSVVHSTSRRSITRQSIKRVREETTRPSGEAAAGAPPNSGRPPRRQAAPEVPAMLSSIGDRQRAMTGAAVAREHKWWQRMPVQLR